MFTLHILGFAALVFRTCMQRPMSSQSNRNLHLLSEIRKSNVTTPYLSSLMPRILNDTAGLTLREQISS